MKNIKCHDFVCFWCFGILLPFFKVMINLQIVKGPKLSEFEKGRITELKKQGKSHRIIAMEIGHSKTVITNNLKIQSLMEQKPHYLTTVKRKIFQKVKKNTAASLKQIKSSTDSP